MGFLTQCFNVFIFLRKKIMLHLLRMGAAGVGGESLYFCNNNNKL